MSQPAAPAGPTIAQQLVTLAHQHYEIGRATTGEPHAHPKAGGTVARPLRGGSWSFRAELARLFHQTEGRVANQGALADALQVLEGQSQDGPPVELATRIATRLDGTLLYDLGRADEFYVRITPKGWTLEEHHDGDHPIFRRTSLTGPQPDPDASAGLEDLDLLRAHTNISDDDWPLTICWMVAVLLPHTPCPGLYLHGEQGTAKTTTGRHLRQTVDPSPAPLGAPPDDIRDWQSAANGARVIGIDNLSSIPPWFSDALCRIVTGEGMARRRLYTDNDLTVIEMRRAVIITAIDAGSLRGDLAERLLAVELDPIDPHHRITDHDSDQAYQRDLPRILGALFTLTAQVLAEMPATQLEMLPRMADFGRLVATVDRIRNTNAADRYAGGLAQLNRAVVDSDPFASTIRAWVQERGQWGGTATDLLTHINIAFSESDHGAKPKWWPADGARCSSRLKRIAPALRAEGIGVEWRKSNGSRTVRLSVLDGGTVTDRASVPRDGASVPRDGAEPPQRPSGTAGHTPEPPNRDGRDGKSPSSSVLAQEERGGGEKRGEVSVPTVPATDDVPDHLFDLAPAYDGPHPGQLADLGYPLHPDQEDQW